MEMFILHQTMEMFILHAYVPTVHSLQTGQIQGEPLDLAAFVDLLATGHTLGRGVHGKWWG